MTLKVLGNCTRGKVFVVSAPAGTGKTTLVRMLTDEFDCIHECISYTTRDPRKGEYEGQDYFFISEASFKEKLSAGEFLEYAGVFGHFYATSAIQVEVELEKGRHVMLVIDTQGAMKLKDAGFQAVYIFIKPPSLEELRQRLLKRKTDSSESVEKRLNWAKDELAVADRYDYLITNDHLANAYDVLRSIVVAEEHKINS